MPPPHPVRCHHTARSFATGDHAWLVDLAIELVEAPTGATPAELVWRSGPPGPAEGPGPLRRITLSADDPVAAVVDRALPTGADLAGVVAPARSRLLGDDRPVTHGRLVHLVTSTGVSVTVLPGPQRRCIGPTAEIQAGRVPDVCRRLLGLSTGPPPVAGIPTVTHLWLSKVACLAATRPGMDWGSVLAAHPFVELLEDVVDDGSDRDGVWEGDELPTFAEVVRNAAGGLTPALVVGWSTRCAEQWSWSRLHRRVATGDPALIGHALTAAQAAWMDDGMFARWAMAELPTPNTALDILDATLHPGAVERLRATLGLSGLSVAPR